MPLGPTLSGSIRFGSFEVDPNSGELRKQGVRVKLQEQPEQVVTREQLRQRLWPADTFVDFDHGLYNAIKRLREAVGDTADTPRFIETVPKRGYRFIGMVSRGESLGTAASSANGDVGPQVVIAPSSQPKGARMHWLSLLAVAASLVLIFGLLIRVNAGGLGTRVRAVWSKSPQIHALAVLPLKNLSDDPGQEYFSYGMTEELITNLAQISGLKVISHTSVMQYAKSSKSLPQIARELGVDGIVEGAVQRSGGRVRITVQLIYAPEEQYLWAASYDRDLRDALELQSNVAAAIVEPIRAKTVSAEPAPRKPGHLPSLEAMEDYLQGNYAIERMASGAGYDGYKEALSHYKRAISEDPSFAAAYTKLAETYDAAYDWRPN